ncbi:MAG: 30S ribosomal protein S21 [Planctomycetota bacterium]
MVIRVQTRDNEPVDKALRRLRKLCNNEGLTRTTKSKAYFEKPSERRRREARERLKAIRIASRSKETGAAKLKNRRRKFKKGARPGAGDGPGNDREGGGMLGETRSSGVRRPEGARVGAH